MAVRPPVRASLLLVPRMLNNGHPSSLPVPPRTPPPSSSSSSLPSSPRPPPRRPFFSAAASGGPKTLTASARLPYHHARVYERIADIGSYAAFVPYCKAARVTEWTEPRPYYAYGEVEGEAGQEGERRDGVSAGEEQQRPRPRQRGEMRRWPARADLTVGWGGIEETYSSRVLCAPGAGIVEALSGREARTGLSGAELARHGLAPTESLSPSGQDGGWGGVGGTGEGGVFRSLVTRWTVVPATWGGQEEEEEEEEEGDWTDVRLDIKFLFENPLYGAVSSAVADRLAPVMVSAFVEQAERVLGKEPRRK